MKRIFRRITLVILLFAMIMSSTACKKAMYVSGNTHVPIEFGKLAYAKVEANRLIFNNVDVTLDFYYAFYRINNNTKEQLKENAEEKQYQPNFAIYLSNNEELIFAEDDNEKIVDCETGVNATLYKYFTFDETFDTDYGYTTKGFNEIQYNYSEKLTIPEGFFVSSCEFVYIHVVYFAYDKINDLIHDHSVLYTVQIKYKLLGVDKVILLND